MNSPQHRDPKGLEWEIFPSSGGIIGYSFDPGPVNEAIAGAVGTIACTAGKIWNSPNSVVGLSIFGTWSLFSDSSIVYYKHNAIEFTYLDGEFSAMAIGNVTGYGYATAYDYDYDCERFYDYYNLENEGHERLHTYQGEITGPFYIPLHIIGGTISVLSTFEFNSVGWAKYNFMEIGPYNGRIF